MVATSEPYCRFGKVKIRAPVPDMTRRAVSDVDWDAAYAAGVGLSLEAALEMGIASGAARRAIADPR